MTEYAKLVISVDSTQAKKADNDLGALDKSASRLTSGLGKMIAPLVSVAAAMAALNKASDVQRQFDVLNAGLITATGSSEKAASAFKALQEFAQKTPYDLNQAVKGFTQLVNLGLTPSEKALMSYGNTASAMGKDLNQMIEAVADAATGEFERLKEFGIKAKVSGDQVSLIFQGVTTKVGNNAKEIESFLIKLGETKFGDAMSLRMATLDGAVSNLGDTWENTFRLVNDAGLGDVMRESVNDAAEALGELNNMLASGEMEGYLEASSIAWSGWAIDITESIRQVSVFLDGTWDEWGEGAKDASKGMYLGFKEFPAEIRAYFQEAAVEAISFVDRLVAQGAYAKDAIAAIFDNTTLDDARKKYDATVTVSNQVRQDMIDDISQEKDATINAVNEKIESSKGLRHEYDLQQKAAKALTADRLAQYKTKGDGSSASSSSAVEKAAKAAQSLVATQAKAEKSFLATTAIVVSSTNAMADAYLSGADNVRELAIQQKIEEELLKTGVGARDAVTAAVNREADAKDRLDINQYIANLRVENASTVAQAAATLQGRDALESFNITKAMTVALSGKKIAVDSAEYKQLLELTKAQLAANKALEQANSIEGIVDRLNPQVKLLRDYTKEQKALNAAIASGIGDTALYQDTLAKLALEYEQNKNAATAWGQFTEGAVDRVDSAFADAWKNIGDGFNGFATSLKDGFKQLLAELAHMAITKPIIMQIGASLGVGGLSAQSGGLFGGGGGSGGLGLFDMASKAYSVATSGFGSAVSAGWSAGEGFLGGMQSAISGGYGYISNAVSGLFSGGAAATGVSNVGFGLGQSLVSGGVGSSGAAAGSSASYASGSGGATALGGALAGIGGALYGYGKSGFKGAATGAAGGVGGYYAGSAIGSLVGPLGTAIGGVIGSTLGSFLGGSLFGGSWQTKDVGLSLAVEDGDFAGRQYEYQKKKGGLFGKNKKRTRLSALDPQMQSALDATYDATEVSVLSLFDRLNVELNDGVLDGLNVASTKISTKDKTAEQIQEEIAKWFGGVADSMVSAVDAATGAGLGGFNFESLTTFVNNLYSVNDVLKNLNVGLFDLNVNGGFMAQSLSAMAGGLDALTASASTYYDNFFSDAEKAEDTLEAVRKQFEAINMTLPASRQGYRDIIEALDVTTEAGRAMFVTLTGLAGNAASAYSILEQRATDAQQKAAAAAQAIIDGLMGSVTSAQSALQRAISAQQKATTEAYNARVNSLNDMVSTATENVSGLTSVGNDLGAALKALRGDSDDAVKMLRAQAQATLQSALATARSGKSLSGFTGLEDALDTVSDNNTDLYGSMEDFARDQGRTANVVAELNAINGKQLTAAEKLQKSLEDQISLAKKAYDDQMTQFDRQLEIAQAQMDAFNGIDTSVKSVEAAIKALNGSLIASLAAKPATGAGSAMANTAANNATVVDTLYQQLFGRTADAGENKYWADRLGSGDLPYAEIVANMTQYASAADKAAMAAKGYATGGLISGPGTGTSDSILTRLSNGEYVMNAESVRMFGTGMLDQMNAGLLPAFAMGGGIGEAGPQLEVTGPSRIFNANQAGSARSGGDSGATATEVRALREEIKSNASYMAKLTKEVADGIDTLVNSGMQINGTVETRAANA